MSYAHKSGALATGLLLAIWVFPAWAADPADPTPPKPKAAPAHRHSVQKKAPPIVLPPLPDGPLRQVPMDLIPATAPKVTFENGLLTISAQNSILGEILKQVRQLTGATIDLPPGGAQERVVTQLGPGHPRDVLATLLNGSQFNYVLLGSPSDPSAIASVTLTPKPGGPADNSGPSQAIANARPPFQQQMLPNNPPQDPEPVADADDNANDAAAEEKDDDADQAQQGQPGQPDQQGQNPNQPNAGPRTPEQLLQMMRQGQQPGAVVPPQPAPPPQE